MCIRDRCLGDPVDQRCDVFALGVVLYELTTGARCFAGKTDFERMLAVVQGDYIAPGDLVASYPAELEAVIRTALATDPRQRFASAAALVEALQRVAISQGWIGGPGAIQRAMRELFGEVPEPWTSLSLIHISEPTRLLSISYAVFCLKKKKNPISTKLY